MDQVVKTVFIIIFFLVFSRLAYPRQNICVDCESKRYVTGSVTKINMDINRLYVLDELTQEVWDFFVPDNILKSLKVGNFVRVYFQSPKLPALNVVKMTPVEYQKKGQNKGYLKKN